MMKQAKRSADCDIAKRLAQAANGPESRITQTGHLIQVKFPALK